MDANDRDYQEPTGRYGMLSFTVKKQNKKEMESAVKTRYLPQEHCAYTALLSVSAPIPIIGYSQVSSEVGENDFTMVVNQ